MVQQQHFIYLAKTSLVGLLLRKSTYDYETTIYFELL